jgi:transcriptional regulator with XRE-family HTH domain
MKLDAYLRTRGLSSQQFAKATGVLTKQTVHNYRHGSRFPSADAMRLIEEKTGGEVTPKDFVEQHAGASEWTPEHANEAANTPAAESAA